MIITLISHERNLGLMTLTDYILDKLGKDNCAVVGTNYLVSDINPTLDQIEQHSKDNKNVIVKYVIPKQHFTNQTVNYPEELKDKSDLVLRVPKFIEEIKRPVNIEIFKGDDNPFMERIREYYK